MELGKVDDVIYALQLAQDEAAKMKAAQKTGAHHVPGAVVRAITKNTTNPEG